MQTLPEMLRKDLIHQTMKLKNKKVIRIIKGELSWNIMKEIVALKTKMYCYLTDDDQVEKKVKNTKKCGIKQEIKFQDYKKCLSSRNLPAQS